MTPVFVNSASIAVRERLVLRSGNWRKIALKARFGFLDHPVFGPVLIDTGYSSRITQGAERSVALKLYNATTRPKLGTEALDFLRSRGLGPADIKTIIITHFHADHVSALNDFPAAKIYADAHAFQQIEAKSHVANVRDGVFVELIPDDLVERLVSIEDAEKVQLPQSLGLGFDVFGDGSAVCVPLPGHAAGHFGIWFGQADHPLLYATDVQWVKAAILNDAVPKLLPAMVSDDSALMRESVTRLKTFAEAGGDFLLCHEPDLHALDLKAVG